MRPDFHEVLIERPRGGMRMRQPRGNRPRVQDWDGEDGFENRVAPRKHKTKRLSDLLGPLRKYLRAQVNRPWNKVYSELVSGIDRRSLLGQHLLDHALHEVERETTLDENGRVQYQPHLGSYWRRQGEVEGLYVHPRTGLLRWREPKRNNQSRREERVQEAMALRSYGQWLDDRRVLLKLEGLWFELEVERVCKTKPSELPRYVLINDVLFRSLVKRQLGKAELLKHGLRNST